MDRSTLTAIRWTARRELSRMGWRGFAGVALLLAAAGLWMGAQLPERRRAEELQSEVAELRARLMSVGGDSARSIPTLTNQLQTFYAFFPEVGSLPDWLATLNTAAARNGLVLESGEYQLARTRGERLARYQMTLPVRGTWPQVRGFLAETLEKIPAAALDDLTVRRESIGSAEIEARIKLTLWLGGQG
jgi:hypothetical protein